MMNNVSPHQVQMAPRIVNNSGQGAQGKDDGYGTGKGMPPVQGTSRHEQGHQHHPAPTAEESVDDSRCAAGHGGGNPRS